MASIDAIITTLMTLLARQSCVAAISGGNNSFLTLDLALVAAARLKAAGQQPTPLWMLSADTGIEQLEIEHHLLKQVAHVQARVAVRIRHQGDRRRRDANDRLFSRQSLLVRPKVVPLERETRVFERELKACGPGKPLTFLSTR